MKIVIDPGPPITVKPDEAPIRKDGTDEADWNCKTNCDFSIEFKNGPFKNNNYDQGKHNSGPVRDDVKVDDHFKYTVTIGTDELDPTIIVKG